MPDTTDYLKRIRDSVRSKDPIELQRKTADVLGTLVAEVSDEELMTRPSADKWSIGEILAHLAEDEVATAWRYRQVVEHNGLPLCAFDQDLWARLGDYAARPPHDSLALFRLLRDANLQFLGNLTTDQWECYGVHSERGRVTVKDLVFHMAGHDTNHIEQIRTILKRRV